MESNIHSDSRILIVDDQISSLANEADALETLGCKIQVARSGGEAIKIAEQSRPDLILLDVLVPGIDGFEVCRCLQANPATRDIPTIFLSARDDHPSVVEGLRLGAVDYIPKPFHFDEMRVRVENHLKTAHLVRQLHASNSALRAEIKRRRTAEQELAARDERLSAISRNDREPWGIAGFIGTSAALKRIIRDIRNIQRFPATSVLITGESGTGKELVARAVHYGCPHSTGNFVAVNCLAIPDELAESSFFGHIKGSFTGAHIDHKGFFDRADGGTLFLDEIGGMPVALQSKLLRVLENWHITPIGSITEHRVRVRVIAGTNINLEDEMECGRFRSDLFFRLARFQIDVPPLRDRREDIPSLARHFLSRFAAEMAIPKRTISEHAMTVLTEHAYPGNVRELKNIIERALIECNGPEIRIEHLHFVGAHGHSATHSDSPRDPRVPLPPVRHVPAGMHDEDRILAFARSHGRIRNSDCQKLLGVSVYRACYLLRKLAAAGLLDRDGTGRWTTYAPTAMDSTHAKALQPASRAIPTPINPS